MAQGHEHATSYKQYFMTWIWLLVMTSLALALGYVEAIPHALKAFLLVGVTLAKIGLIGAIFMHLKFERMNLVMLTFSPLVLAIVLFFFTFGDTRVDPTHELINRVGEPAAAAAPAEGH